MKTKKMTPVTVAPVKRENAATVSRDGNAIVAPLVFGPQEREDGFYLTFAGDDAE
ncbi:anacyclamide/piricyclamide family prenylated cyclic peptide [Roseofilum reptotaenium CS-1145]|uniref:Anacyclamide/piricyclamide family prenylated cyclic peptide n=1 Tax=Roseofilum reptotaenium AO1-A TaxID=1925591 RepID=A0A1L9QPZ9_9CYAN|nr:anacyclamide/piricyclamide family prenylated cyclic peptide [Roseofilum reptotaenium]MDB9517515.1 anacyclamide/piricyclamide family prenylated cyclic peptide [Roseofilum reptotaenium CS-1145]OJJ24755.1 anacyclamide/piricyclamide family prenylated cyclic peptide [Roseofilum reptotaenium AO1-A]